MWMKVMYKKGVPLYFFFISFRAHYLLKYNVTASGGMGGWAGGKRFQLPTPN